MTRLRKLLVVDVGVVHASSELIVDSYKKDICEVIESLSKFISELLKCTDLPIGK